MRLDAGTGSPWQGWTRMGPLSRFSGKPCTNACFTSNTVMANLMDAVTCQNIIMISTLGVGA
eukprot:4638509-Amphidinium_carterae.1